MSIQLIIVMKTYQSVAYLCVSIILKFVDSLLIDSGVRISLGLTDKNQFDSVSSDS